jgi:hypothetical protein
MFTMMNHARLNVGLEGVAISERAYQQARQYALDRVQGRTLGREGAPSATIIGHPDVRRMLMDMKAQVEAMRSLAYYAAGQMDRARGHKDSATRQSAQTLVDLLIPVVKGWCTDSALGVTSDGVQVHGGMGFIEETGASQHLRDARITTIYEGTTGIQANDLIGRKLARDGGAAMKRLVATMGDDVESASAAIGRADATLEGIATALRAGLGALSEATEWLLTAPSREAAAGAVPYLQLCGTVIAGWLMARSAHAATVRLARGDADAEFLAAKRITAHHYALHSAAAGRCASRHGR